MKKIMVIAGGKWQIPIIKRAKEMGYYVINTNLYEDSPGFEYADAREIVDVLDKEKNLEIAKKYKPDGIISDQCEIAIPTIAYVSQKLGLPSIGVENAELFTNKYLMRKFCEKINYPCPKFKLCKTIDEALNFLTENKKIVIKPLDSQSSRGVFTVSTAEDLISHYKETQSYTRCNDCILVEQFINGTEFTVDGIMWNGKHRCLAISEKKHFADYPNVASELLFSYSKYNTDLLEKQHDYLIESTKLPFGITHSEYIFSEKTQTFHLVEMAVRGGGVNISNKIVTAVSGVDNIGFLIKASMGEYIEPQSLQPQFKRYAVLKFFDFPSGIVKNIHGVDAIENNKNIIDYSVNFNVGDKISPPTDDSKRVGYYTAVADSYQELKRTMEYIDSKFYVDCEVNYDNQ